MSIDLDIIIYAVAAALIIWRLWSVLGSRSGDEIQRPNPFIPPEPPPAPDTPKDAPFNAPPTLTLPPASLAGGLAQIASIDAGFNEKLFLQQARASFTTIVAAYASGALDSVAELLSPALLAHFQQAAAVRREAGQTAQTKILGIQDAEVTAAHAEGTQAFITVKFTSTQENILRDARGALIGGTEGQAESVTDVWTFTRDTAAPESPWILSETRV